MGSKQKDPEETLREFPHSHRLAMYYFGIPRQHILDAEQVSVSPETFRLHLCDDEGREWKGNLRVPPYTGTVYSISVSDLVDQTKGCPLCRGTGKVAQEYE